MKTLKNERLNQTGWEPTLDRVLIKPVEREYMSAGGIMISETAQDFNKLMKGTIVACGPGRVDVHGDMIEMTLCAGDLVYFDRACGMDVEFSRDVKYKVCREAEVILRSVS